MKKLFLLLTGIIVLITFTGCNTLRTPMHVSYTRNSKKYLTSHATASLQMPAGLHVAKASEQYNIPSTTVRGAIPASVTPPDLAKKNSGAKKLPHVDDDSVPQPPKPFLKPIYGHHNTL